MGRVVVDVMPKPEILDPQDVAERQRAARTLMLRPLLTADGPHADDFRLVRRHQGELVKMFAEGLGYRLAVDPSSARLFKAGLGAPLGTGRQWTSWISLQDEVAAIRHLLTADVEGPVNLVGPAPVTNRDFTKALGRAVHRPTVPVPVPGFVLRAAVGPFADEGILIGQRLAPAVLQRSGFAFAHNDVDAALRASL